MGIEPTRPAWKAGILPLNYTRINLFVFVTLVNFITSSRRCQQYTFIFCQIKSHRRRAQLRADVSPSRFSSKSVSLNSNIRAAYFLLRLLSIAVYTGCDNDAIAAPIKDTAMPTPRAFHSNTAVNPSPNINTPAMPSVRATAVAGLFTFLSSRRKVSNPCSALSVSCAGQYCLRIPSISRRSSAVGAE